MIEADFHRFYGVDLREAIDEGCRWVWTRIWALPPDSALARLGGSQKQQSTGGTQRVSIDEFLASVPAETKH